MCHLTVEWWGRFDVDLGTRPSAFRDCMDYTSPAPYPLVCRVVAYGQPLAEAIGGARLHHQLEPALLMAEEWRAGTVTFDFDDDVLRVRMSVCIIGRVWGAVCADASVSLSPNSSAAAMPLARCSPHQRHSHV